MFVFNSDSKTPTKTKSNELFFISFLADTRMWFVPVEPCLISLPQSSTQNLFSVYLCPTGWSTFVDTTLKHPLPLCESKQCYKSKLFAKQFVLAKEISDLSCYLVSSLGRDPKSWPSQISYDCLGWKGHLKGSLPTLLTQAKVWSWTHLLSASSGKAFHVSQDGDSIFLGPPFNI